MNKTLEEVEDIIRRFHHGKKCKLISIDRERGIFNFEFERDESLIQEGEII